MATGAYPANQAGAHVNAGWDGDAICAFNCAATGENPIRSKFALNRLRRHLGNKARGRRNRESQGECREACSVE
jgi:hypothetical protein